MRDLDDTDLQILRILLDDASRTYSDIADIVAVSPPTVSDRIERLQNIGVIRRFTIDVDDSKLSDGVSVLVEVDLEPTVEHDVVDRFAALDAVEHAFLTADSSVLVHANVARDAVRELIADAIDLDRIERYDVRLLAESVWQPSIDEEAVERPLERSSPR
jgi:DNA-binding Lrp family transcriptional regulator